MARQSLRSQLHTQHVAQASRVRSRRLRITRLTQALLGCAILTPAFAGPTLNAHTLPSGMQVQNGQASVLTQGHQMTVRNSQGAILNWQNFSIGSSASVYFDQSNSSSKVLNRVLGNDPSQILGQLSSNGQVWLLNPNGVLFGRDARVDVASLVTSTLRLNDNDFLAGRYRFDSQAGDAGMLRNEGSIHSSLGGHVVLLGSRVENAGRIEAPQGQVALAAARQVELVDTGAPNLRVQVDVPAGEVLNLGQLQAHGGRIDVHAATVNQQGLVKADTLSTDAQGRIVLKASEVLSLAGSSQISADGVTGGTIQLDASQGTAWVRGQVSAQGSQGRGGELKLLGQQIGVLDGAQLIVSGQSGGGTLLVGGGAEGKDASVPNARAVYVGEQASLSADALKQGQGGNIVLWSNEATRAYGRFSAKGGAQGGDGGLVETSGGWLDARPAGMSLQAPKGRAGTWLLDPNNITISDGVPDTNISAGPTFTSTNDNSKISTATIAAALNAGNSVTVATATNGSNNEAGDINVSGANLNVAPASAVSLTLQAHRNINLSNSTLKSSGSALSVNLEPQAGGVSISNSSILTAGGNIRLGTAQSVCITGLGCSDANAGPWVKGSINIQSSTLDAGTGNIEAGGAAETTSGIKVGGATLKAEQMRLHGWVNKNTGYGLEISNSDLLVPGGLNLLGRSNEGVGVQFTSSNLRAGGDVVVEGQSNKSLRLAGQAAWDPAIEINLGSLDFSTATSASILGRYSGTPLQSVDVTLYQVNAVQLPSNGTLRIIGTTGVSLFAEASSPPLVIRGGQGSSLVLDSDRGIGLDNVRIQSGGNLTLGQNRERCQSPGLNCQTRVWTGGNVIFNRSTIDLGEGSLTGGGGWSDSAVGVTIQDSQVSASTIDLVGASSAWAGVYLQGRNTLSATKQFHLRGESSKDGQAGVLVDAGNQLSLQANVQNATATMTLTGRSISNAYGLNIRGGDPAANNQTRLTVTNAQFTASGSGLRLNGNLAPNADGVLLDLSQARGGVTHSLQGTDVSTQLMGLGLQYSKILGPLSNLAGTQLSLSSSGSASIKKSQLSAASPISLRTDGSISLDESTLVTQAGGIQLQAGTSAWEAIDIRKSSLRILGAADQIRLEGLNGAPAQRGTFGDGKGTGIWLRDGAVLEAPGTGSQIVINGKGGANGGVGVTLNGVQLQAGAVQITGQGVADAGDVYNAFGVAAAVSTDGLNTPTRITTQQLTVDGRSDASASQDRKAGVNFDGGTTIQLSGHKASTVSGDSVVLQDSTVRGDASAWTVSSGDSTRSTRSTFDFSTGTGTTVSILADTDGNQLGRVRLNNTQINTGGGDFKAQGVGIHGSDDPNPSLAVNGSNGIFFDRGGVNAGQGRIDLLGSGGYAGVNFWGPDPIILLADTINIQGKRHPDSPAPAAVIGVSVGDFANSVFTPLNLKARNIIVSGTGAAYNATEKVASLGMGLYSTGTWEASNQISISTDAGGLELGGLTLKAPNISINSAEQFETQQAKILAGNLATITALGGTDPSKAFGIRMGQNAVIQGADIVLEGKARAGVGVELATTGTESVLQASNSITITGSDASGVHDGLAVSGDWNLIAGDTISIISERGVNLAERNVNLPHYMAGKRLQVQVNKHPGGSISSAEAENFSATIADMPSTAVTSVSFDSAAPIVLDGVINSPSRVELGADRITIGSQGGIRSSATGDAVRLQGFTNPGMQSFTNQAGGNALQTPNGRWIVRATKPEVVQWLGLQPTFTAYDGERFPPALDAAGNWVTPGAGNGVIYQISSATQDPATQSTQVVVSTATQAVSIPTVMSTPSEGRVLDVIPALGHSLDESKPSFGSINTSSMSRAELVTLLAARAAYKKKLFADTLHQLQLDPSLADVRACANISELNAGDCLLTESLKREIRAAQALESLQRSKARKVRQAELPSIERKVALVIGINEYSDKRVPGLESAVPDARAIHELIEQQLGYEAVVLENASKQSIITALNKIALEAGPNDSVMIYYAGHGEVLPTSGMGYWLPADARVDKPQSWLSNADIARMVALIGAKQVMLVSDSCYSGTLAGTDRVQLAGDLAADDLLSRKAVVVMSSGGNEPVSDEGRDGHSVFAWHLMQKLRETAAWQVGSQAFTQVRDAVLKDFPQTPQYGAARAAGHQDNTDYVFERRQTDKQ